MKKYDFVIIGAGIFGCTCARLLTDRGYKVLVVDKNDFVGGMCHDEQMFGINVHKFGPHIFRTSNKKVWNFVNRFTEFNNFVNSPIANYEGELYNLPFNMNTFTKIWPDVVTPSDAKVKIEQEKTHFENPENLEQQATNLVGKTIFEKLIKGYTEKQWGRPCSELSPEIIKRLPLRFTFDNNYSNTRYQGIPTKGYDSMFKRMLAGIDVQLKVDYQRHKLKYKLLGNKIIYTGPIDRFYRYKYGKLQFRSLNFVEKILDEENFQGNAVVNYTSCKQKFTRIVEHKHFNNDISDKTVITYEYPAEWTSKKERFYPIDTDRNRNLLAKYQKIKTDVIFGGRLGLYKYLDMDKSIELAMELCEKL